MRPLLALAAVPLLGGCGLVVMDPAGDVARQQADLILWATGLMLLIIVPVMALVVLFAWRYRASNEEADYRPDWDHSTGLELVIWSAPLLIIIALGALTWVATHTLDPFRPLARTAPGRAVAADVKPLEIQVVALDWKWLFIYPEQGIATVNQLALPVNRPVHFRMTSSAVMNTFWVPTMAGMIYTMPGMETQLHAVLNRAGRFEGVSANYSGAGFSDMKFWTYAYNGDGFDRWVEQVRRRPARLDTATYLQLEKPSERVPAAGFGAVERGLFARITGMCVKPDTTCMGESMRHHTTPVPHAPVADRPADADKPEGALFKAPQDKRGGENRDAPSAAPASPEDREPSTNDKRQTPTASLSPLPDAATRGVRA
jgi:cytochrome o ubiquinol oxidase subunit 2